MSDNKIVRGMREVIELARTSTLPLPEVGHKPAIDADRDLVKEIAMDIGKSTVEHIEIMYPKMFEAVAETARLSIRNHIYNEIMAALEINDFEAIRTRLEMRRKDRRARLKLYRDLRKRQFQDQD